MSGGLQLIHSLVTVFSYVLMLRFLLQVSRADFYNPVSQYVVKFSEPVCGPLRKFIPTKGRLDFVSIGLAVLLHLLFWFWVTSSSNAGISPVAVFARSGYDVTMILLNCYFVSLIVLVIMSWLSMANPATAQNPVWPIVNQIIEPLAGPLRKIIPPIGGLDLSVLVLFLGIQFAKLLNAQFWSLWLN